MLAAVHGEDGLGADIDDWGVWLLVGANWPGASGVRFFFEGRRWKAFDFDGSLGAPVFKWR